MSESDASRLGSPDPVDVPAAAASALGFCLADVVRSKQEVVSIAYEATVEEALALLAEHRFLSVPVRRPDGAPAPSGAAEDAPFSGICNLWDLVTAICFQPLFRAYDDEKLSREMLSDDKIDDTLRLDVFHAHVGDVVGVSAESRMLWVRDWNSSLASVIEIFSQGVHRILVRGEAGSSDERDYRFLSQTDVVNFLHGALVEGGGAGGEPHGLDPLLARSVADLGIVGAAARDGESRLVSATTANSALTCFRRLTVHELYALPVVCHETGRLVGTLSASDLRGIGRATFKNTMMPVMEYLAVVQGGAGGRKGPRTPVTCLATDSLARVTSLAREHRVHRLWVCDPDTGAPTGVVSLSDMIRAFYGRV